MHYVHDIDPIIFSLGPVSVHWYGVMWWKIAEQSLHM